MLATRKIARANVKRSLEDYLIYFFTLTFAVSLFYSFNSIEEQFEALGLPDLYSYLSAAEGAMTACSVLVSFIIGFLIVYANGFLMKRRRREFGLYGILGMERREIAALMAWEGLLIGGAALFLGLALGVAFSQVISMATVKMARGGVNDYTFIFSPKAAVLSAVFFLLTFGLVHLFQMRKMRRMKLIDLLYADKKKEEIPEAGKGKWFLCIFSFLLTGTGYVIIFKSFDYNFFTAVSTGFLFVSAGTVFFFLSVWSALLWYLKKKKSCYYHKLNLFAVSRMGSRMRWERLSLAVVCILMYLSVSVMGTGTGMGQSFIKEKENMVPFDLSIIYYYDGWYSDERMKQITIEEALREKDPELAGCFERTGEISFYQHDKLTMRELFGAYAADEEEKRAYEKEAVMMVGLEDYNRIRALQGQEPVLLGEDEYAVSYNDPEAEKVLKQYMKQEKRPVRAAGKTLSFKKDGLYRTTLYNRNVLLDYGTLVIPQDLADQYEPFMKVMDALFLRGPDGMPEGTAEAVQSGQLLMEREGMVFQSKEELLIEFLSDRITMSYLGIYLGITFLITAGAMLALQQLTQAVEDEKGYQLLSKLGADERDRRRAFAMQLKLYFGLPLAAAALHSAVTMWGICRKVPYLTAGDILRNVLFAAGLAGCVYGIYFLAAYAGCRRILKL